MKKIYAMLLVFVMVAMLFGCTTQEKNLNMVKDKFVDLEVLAIGATSFIVLDASYAIYVRCDAVHYLIVNETVLLRTNVQSE